MLPGEPHDSRPISLSTFVYRTLLERIATGAFPAGGRIVIDQIAIELRVSLIPVREALARLNAEGLVEHQPNKGYRVTAAPATRDYRELYLARLVLEFGAIRQSGDTVSAPELQRLRDINAKIAALKPSKTFRGFSRFVELNDQFHAELVALSQNKTLMELYQKLAYGSRVARGLQGRGIPDLRENVREHEAIIRALENHDKAAAAAAVERHIRAGMDRFLKDLSRRKSSLPTG